MLGNAAAGGVRAVTELAGTHTDIAHPASAPDPLSRVLVLLLKGVLYRESDLATWSQLVTLQSRAREYLAVLGLELVVDEAEGYAFVKSRTEQVEDADDAEPAVPRLVARRSLTFAVSLLLALLRRKLAEFDARGGDTRLVMTRPEIIEMLRVFLPDRNDEARLFSQIDTHITKAVDLGFLKRLGGNSPSAPPAYEVRRIIKAFVDAQWLSDLDARLAEYRESLGRDLKELRSDDE
jgi:hypothetical protein